jgi:hypothetical protein
VKNRSLKEAAPILGVSVRLLHALSEQGTLKTVKIAGRRLLPHAELVRLMTTGCCNSNFSPQTPQAGFTRAGPRRGDSRLPPKERHADFI